MKNGSLHSVNHTQSPFLVFNLCSKIINLPADELKSSFAHEKVCKSNFVRNFPSTAFEKNTELLMTD